ncbi:MAG: EF-hand domain-containing protein [Cyanobacteria bacterium J06626_18]
MSHDYLDASLPKLAERLPKQRLEYAKAEFAKLDLNQNGTIELDEFLALAVAKEVKRVMARFNATDTNHDGTITFDEFLCASVPHYALLKKFAEFDLEENGLLTIEEAAAIVDKLVLPFDREDLEAEIRKVDRDGDGQVSYEEFLGLVVHHGLQ